jgi:DNA recombination protein RmuC
VANILPSAIVVLLLIIGLVLALLLRRPAAPGQDAMERSLDRVERRLRDEMARNREELANSLRAFSESVVRNMSEMAGAQGAGLARLTEATEQRLEAIRGTIDERLKTLQQENAAKLELMRRTVDEQLQGTLEKRLGESFRLVSERLEQVYKGLGEMQNLAAGVGDLKRALTNVRVRGSWGEIQLGALLEDTLHPDQYERNVATTGTAERVEFAIRLPGSEAGSAVYLPIDAKFPMEDYQRMLDAAERGEAAEVEACAKQLEQRIRLCAKDIREKYVAPPATTDFGIMYLPTESLYAEVLRRPGLVEALQRDFRVAITGPTTLAAFLNSLQMGFRTLAIEQRSSEVWEVLGAVKTEFARYAEVLQRVHKKLEEASNTVDRGLVRTRQIERKLRNVEALSPADAGVLLPEVNGAELEDAGVLEETSA